MKKITLCTLLIIVFFSVKSQPFYQDKNISLEASLNTRDSTIFFKITNNSKRTMYLYAWKKAYGTNSPFLYYTYGIYLKGSIMPVTPWIHERMIFRRIFQNASDIIIIPKGEFESNSPPIDLKNFKIIITIEYILIPKKAYIPDKKYYNDKFMKYLKRRGYKIHTIKTPELILDHNNRLIIDCKM